MADGRNGLGNQPPRTIGSSASPLLKKVDGSHHDVKATPDEVRLLWLWIESGAPYAGSYAGLRNEEQQRTADRATAAVLGAKRSVLHRRCFSCHRETPGSEIHLQPPPLTLTKKPVRKAPVNRPTGVFERIVGENDPVAHFSPNVLLNFTRPELSPLLLGPLARAAGGYESCGILFKDKNDPDYQQLLAGLRQGQALFGREPRYGTAGFRPNRQYIREMKKYGILPVSFDPARDPIDIFQTDQNYWRSLWN